MFCFISHRPAHPTLDDAFFSIDDFNRETEELESLSRSRGGLDDDDDDDGDEDVDLFAAVMDEFEDEYEEDEEDADEDDGAYSKSINLACFYVLIVCLCPYYLIDPMYKDFFTPPPRPPPSPTSSKNKPTSSKKQSKPVRTANELDPPSDPSSSKPKTTKVSFNTEVRVKTIEARRNTPAERLDFYRRMGLGRGAMGIQTGGREPGEIVGDEEEGEWEDEDGEEVDWDMEKFGDVDDSDDEEGDEDGDEEGEEEMDLDDNGSDAAGEEAGEDNRVGIEDYPEVEE